MNGWTDFGGMSHAPCGRASRRRARWWAPQQASMPMRHDFGGVSSQDRGALKEDVPEQLNAIESEAAVLVDEYDTPILDAPDEPVIARASRDNVRGLYSAIRSCYAHDRFCFLNGVSKCSRVSLFSGLNNLIDVKLEPTYSAICRCTEGDLGMVIVPELRRLDRSWIRGWYYGCGWGPEENVHMPFVTLALSRKQEFEVCRYETGSPTLLVQTLVTRGIAAPTLDGMIASKKLLGTFDVSRVATEAPLFQTGYLTMVGQAQHDGIKHYCPDYPTREVSERFNLSLLDCLTGDESRWESYRTSLSQLLKAAD